MKNKPFVITFAFLILVAVILSSCSLPKRPSATQAPVTAVTGSETAIPSSESAAPIEATPTPIASPTAEPTTVPVASPTPAITDTPLPAPTHTPLSILLPKKSSVTGETIPNGKPVDSWNSIPIPEAAISAQEKRNESGERYYIFSIQSNIDTLLTYYSAALAERDWLSTEGGRGERVAVAFFVKRDKLLRLEVILEDASQNLILVKIFKWSIFVW